MYTAGSSVWMACRKLSTEGAAWTVDGRLFHTVMVDGRNENFVHIHPGADLPDVVGLGAASYSNVGHHEAVDWNFDFIVNNFVEHYDFALYSSVLKWLPL